MKTILFLLSILITGPTFSQTIISGTIQTKQGESIPGVNIFLENSYDGASSDSLGNFKFSTSEKGPLQLVASYIGYEKWTARLDSSSTQKLLLILKESVNALDAVTITAGTFAASDQKRASIMDPIDIYTTASANADVMAAMRTMPGAQASPDDGRLMVRGGDAYESKTYMDGLLAAKPYDSKTPDLATRGRFSPSMFNGVQFSSGGYSAEYGQALSSILELNSTDVSPADVLGISLMTIGAEANYAKAFQQSSVMGSAGYTNLGPYSTLLPSKLNWTKPVESFNLNTNYKYKPNSTGILKAFVNADFGSLAYQTIQDDDTPFNFSNKNKNIYSNANYAGCLGDKTCFKIGLANTSDQNSIQLNETTINTKEFNLESRFSVTHFFTDRINIHAGVGDTYDQYDEDIIIHGETLFDPRLREHLFSIYTESEIKFSKYIALRPGIRSEYSSLLQKWNLAPRLAFAAKTGKNSQLSAAWGKYYQNPQLDYLKFTTKLNFEKATHYILSYQTGLASKRLFRCELYHKSYQNLVTWEGLNPYQPENISNTGNGYANGLDLFWKDKKSLKHLEYWVTYSYIDTKRKYKNYPSLAQPEFISDHTFSLVTKYWAHKISTQFGTSFTMASPRNYNDVNTPEFMDLSTNWYNNLCVNMSHIFYLGDQYSVFYVSLSNLPGNDGITGYRPSNVADAAGNYSLVPIKRDRKRFLFMGLFLSF
ncbi:MAG: carboxypeptidase-like regulatory domain-containing protein [Prolixibacteraceae bacterium]